MKRSVLWSIILFLSWTSASLADVVIAREAGVTEVIGHAWENVSD